jgi:hypothetical protein
MGSAPAAQAEGARAHASGAPRQAPASPHVLFALPWSREKPGAHAWLHAPPKGAPLVHAGAVALSAMPPPPPPPPAAARGGQRTRYFSRRALVSARRPASESALSGGAPPRKPSTWNSFPRQQKGDVGGALFTRGQLVFKLQPIVGHQNTEPVEAQKEATTPFSAAPWGAAQGAAAAGSPGAPSAPFTNRRTVRAGLGTRADQMPPGMLVIVEKAGAPHFRKQQFAPGGQLPYATVAAGT